MGIFEKSNSRKFKEVCGVKERISGKPWFDSEAKDLVKRRKTQKEKWLNMQD